MQVFFLSPAQYQLLIAPFLGMTRKGQSSCLFSVLSQVRNNYGNKSEPKTYPKKKRQSLDSHNRQETKQVSTTIPLQSVP